MRAPSDDVGVAVDVLGGGVQREVDAEGQRPLEVRRKKGVIADGDGAVRARALSDGAEVDQVHERVGGGLDPDAGRAGLEGLLEGVEVAQVHVVDLEAAVAEHRFEQAIGSAVEVAVHDQALAGLEQHQGCRFGGHARGEGKSAHAAFECGQAVLQGATRGIAAARVVIGPGTVDVFKSEGGGLEDGGHHGAEVGLGVVAGVNRECLEVHSWQSWRAGGPGLPRSNSRRAWTVPGTRHCRPANRLRRRKSAGLEAGPQRQVRLQGGARSYTV